MNNSLSIEDKGILNYHSTLYIIDDVKEMLKRYNNELQSLPKEKIIEYGKDKYKCSFNDIIVILGCILLLQNYTPEEFPGNTSINPTIYKHRTTIV